jgi:hypothetical protein
MHISSVITRPFARGLARPLIAASAFLLASGLTSAQVTPGPGGSIVGQPPGQGSAERSGAIIGQPPPTGPGSRSGGIGSGPPPLAPGQVGPIQPMAPAISSPEARDPVKDRLNRANREAADIDRDGRISPEEATRIPGGSGLPR